MFEKLISENKALDEKQVADFIKQWDENHKEVGDFIAEMNKKENLDKVKNIIKTPLEKLSKDLVKNFDQNTKTSKIKIGDTEYSFSTQECSEVLLSYWVFCQNKEIAKNRQEYTQWKLLIDFDRGSISFWRQVNAILDSLKEAETSSVVSQTKADVSKLKKDVQKSEAVTNTGEKIPEGNFIEVKTSMTDNLMYIPKNFNPEKQQLNIFFCWFGIDMESMKRDVFSRGLMPDQAYCIVQWDADKISRTSSQKAFRYNNIINSFGNFKSNLETKTINGQQFKNICLIWHSAWWRVVDVITWKIKNDSNIHLKTIIIDGTYSANQWAQTVQLWSDWKIYYVPNTTTEMYSKNKWGVAMAWKNHMSIISAALQDAGVLSV